MKQEEINLFGDDYVYTVLNACENEEDKKVLVEDEVVLICKEDKTTGDHDILGIVPVPKGFMDTVLKIYEEFNDIADEEAFKGDKDKPKKSLKTIPKK